MKIKVLLTLAASAGLLASVLSVVVPEATVPFYATSIALMLLVVFAQDYLPRSDSKGRRLGTITPFPPAQRSRRRIGMAS